MAFLGNRSDVSKVIWLGWCPCEKKKRNTDAGARSCEERQRCERRVYKPRKAWDGWQPSWGRRKAWNGFSLRTSWGETVLLLSSGLQNLERINISCLKLSSLWDFVLAAPGNSYTRLNECWREAETSFLCVGAELAMGSLCWPAWQGGQGCVVGFDQTSELALVRRAVGAVRHRPLAGWRCCAGPRFGRGGRGRWGAEPRGRVW